MCTGRMDPATVAGAFRKGLDGLMVVGCYFGDCHYITGNVQAQAKMNMTRRMLAHIGVNPERLAFRQCSSGEASVFVDLINEFQANLHKLGPLGGEGDKTPTPGVFDKLAAAEKVLAGEKMRWVIGKRTEFLTSGNKYGEIFTDHEFNRAIDMIAVEELEVQEILMKLAEGARSVKELASQLALPPERIFRTITVLVRRELVSLKAVAQRTPVYQLVPQEV
jgi:F420-non-reducing hydrogenase iron-sulfur subunit